MQVCMDASDWLMGLVQEDGGTGSSSPSNELLECARPPLLERRLRPQHEQALKCPRCDSTHTKFCYYNNYSLSQPRYFCKTCRRYWTKGGSLRNVPVGGGCRKNKRSSKKPAEHHVFGLYPHQVVPNFCDATELHLSFSPGMQSSLLEQLKEPPPNLNIMECNYSLMLDGSINGEFMTDSKFGRGHTFMSAGNVGLGDVGDVLAPLNLINAPSSTISFDFSQTNGNTLLTEPCNKLTLPFDGQDDADRVETKPANQVLSLEWQENGQGACSDANRNSFGYSNGLGLWGGMINGQGPSAAL